jgi:hypothetical protein
MKNNQIINTIINCRKMIHDPDDGNTILSQLSDIAFDDCIYRTFNEGLRLDKANKPILIIDRYHKYFFNNQVLCIRKIFDESKDIYSLGNIFNIMYSNAKMVTRDSYLEANNDQIINQGTARKQTIQIEYLNNLYDQISKTNASGRTKNDKLYIPYLDRMKLYLEKSDILKRYTNSYIAHSSCKGKRKISNEELNKININRLQESYKKIQWLACNLSRYIGELILFEVPIVPYNQFEGWVGSIFNKNIERSLNTYWNKRYSLFSAWQYKYWYGNSIYITPFELSK